MKKFMTPEIKISEFNIESVVTTSGESAKLSGFDDMPAGSAYTSIAIEEILNKNSVSVSL